MNACKCGCTEFMAKIVTTSEVKVTVGTCGLERVSGTEKEKLTEYKGLFVCVKCGTEYMDIEYDSSNNADTDSRIRRCSCGGASFSAHQQCYHDVVVNGDNIFEKDIEIYYAERPYGPYYCIQCGAEYDELEELDKFKAS